MWHPDSFGMAVIASIVFGLIGIVLTLVGFKLFDWITPKIDVQRELAEKHNIAVAIVVGAMVIGTALVIAAIVGA